MSISSRQRDGCSCTPFTFESSTATFEVSKSKDVDPKPVARVGLSRPREEAVDRR